MGGAAVLTTLLENAAGFSHVWLQNQQGLLLFCGLGKTFTLHVHCMCLHKLSILAVQPHGASVCLTWKHMGDAAVRGRALRNDSTSERGQDYCLVRLDRVVLFQSYLHNENPQWLIVIYCYSLLFAPSLSHLHFSCSYILGATRTNERFLHRALFFVLFHFMFRRHPSGLVIFRCGETCRTTLIQTRG